MTSPNEDGRWLLAETRRVVSRLAAPPEAQLAHLVALGGDLGVDELALEFDDVVRAALAVDGLMSDAQRALLERVDEALAMMSDAEGHDLWTEDALLGAQEWRDLREHAGRALGALPPLADPRR